MIAPDPAPQGNPYPGLRPFLEHEEQLFFGRERQVDAMADKLGQTHFLAVVGTSGSGKSSLVNCGLRPALHRGLIAHAGSAWRIAQFRPGSAPIRALAQALASEGVLYRDLPAGPFSPAELVEASLRMSSLGLVDAFEQAHLDPGVNLLVVVDQFEELFRYQSVGTGDAAAQQHHAQEATAFVNLLLAVADQRPATIHVVLTMRSDFLGDCAQFNGLPEAINRGQYLVPRMTRDDRRHAIEGPALMHGARIDPVLLTRLVNDVGELPDQLSLLQHALNRTWSRWQAATGGHGPIELAHYEAVGSMAEALDQHAEETYGRLGTDAQRALCEKVFKALTDRGTDARGVRRPTRLDTLCSLTGASADAVRAVVDVFRAPDCCFLMPPAGEPLAADTVVDISHESLMRVWRRLREWTDEESRSAANLHRLAQTAALHEQRLSALLADPELQMALNWRQRDQPNAAWAAQYGEPFDAAMRFLDASESARTAESQAQRRTAERRRTLTLLTFAALIGLSAFSAYNWLVARQAAAVSEFAFQQMREKQEALSQAIRDAKLSQANALVALKAAEDSAREASAARQKAEALELSLAALQARNLTRPPPPVVALGAQPPAAPAPTPGAGTTAPAGAARALDGAVLGRIMPALPASERAGWAATLNEVMAQYNINTPLRQAAFLAQVAQESSQLRYLEEPWGPSPQQQRYEPPSSLARSLGNVEPGDGQRYRGRGLIWITGRANYQRCSQALGVDLVANPERAATRDIGAATAAWFWASRGLNELADRQDLTQITRRINGGLTAMEERVRLFEKAKAALGA